MKKADVAISSYTPYRRKRYTIYCKNHKIALHKKTKIMGILNATPDSFSQDGCYTNGPRDIAYAIAYAHRLIKDGADILDIGGESTRPGAKRISEKEEIVRIIPIIQTLAKKIKKPISADTYKPDVARRALDAGAAIINTIMGTSPDKKLLSMIKNYNATIVLMHIRGTPQTMQKNIHYANIESDIIRELKKSIEKCLEIGIKSDRIIIDPGIGFGKTVAHNLTIINHLAQLQALDYPILIGPSRKSFIGKVLRKEVGGRMMGTAASVTAAILRGAHIIRVHDVKEMRDVVKITDAIAAT